MWEHYCEEEGCVIAIGKGEPCNWCNMTEEMSINQTQLNGPEFGATLFSITPNSILLKGNLKC